MSTERRDHVQPSDIVSRLRDSYSIPAGHGFGDAEDRDVRLGKLIALLADRPEAEDLAGFLITLREVLLCAPGGANTVSDELGHTLETLFRQSDAYNLAFALYSGRYAIRATSPEELLAEIISERGDALLGEMEEILLVDDEEEDADEATESPATDAAPPRHFNLCDHRSLTLIFVNAELERLFTFDFHRSPEAGVVNFHIEGEATTLNIETEDAPERDGGENTSATVTITGHEEISILGKGDAHLFTLRCYASPDAGGGFSVAFTEHREDGSRVLFVSDDSQGSQASSDAPPFAEVCEAVIEPLRAFLDHPAMLDDVAERIHDAIEDLFNSKSPKVSNGSGVAFLLHGFTKGEPK